MRRITTTPVIAHRAESALTIGLAQPKRLAVPALTNKRNLLNADIG